MTDQTVMIPVLVSATVNVELMVAVRPLGRPDTFRVDGSAVRTALAYVTPEGFTVEEITDWEELPR